jgi:hypothetical protein
VPTYAVTDQKRFESGKLPLLNVNVYTGKLSVLSSWPLASENESQYRAVAAEFPRKMWALVAARSRYRVPQSPMSLKLTQKVPGT